MSWFFKKHQIAVSIGKSESGWNVWSVWETQSKVSRVWEAGMISSCFSPAVRTLAWTHHN